MSKIHSNSTDELVSQLLADHFVSPQLSAANSDPIPDLDTGIAESLAQPVGFPSLNEFVFEGDLVAIVLQDNIAKPIEILSVLTSALVDAGIATTDMYVVISPRTAEYLGLDQADYLPATDDAEKPTPILELELGNRKLNLQVHAASNPIGNSYLVANQEGEPVVVNRVLVDADVVIPIGFPVSGEASQQVDCVYPTFSSVEAQSRLPKASFLTRNEEINLANDSLGCFFSIQLVCGPGNLIHEVICGARNEVISLARNATSHLWSFHCDHPADFTVTTIESVDQSWDDLVNAVAIADGVSKSENPIVIWSEVDKMPNRQIRLACRIQFDPSANTGLDEKLQRFVDVLQQRPVFLRSKLKRQEVEDLGFGFIQTGEEILKIAGDSQNRILIRDAHHCQIIENVESTNS
ncbi:MAG: hypothetical protein AAF623_13630 [Planctomycetota bacterium]